MPDGHLNGSSLWGVTGCIGLVNVTSRPRLIDEIPGKDGRLILVHTPSDGVHAVCHSCLMVLVKLDDCWVNKEFFWMLSPAPDDIAIQSISSSPVVCQR